MSLSAQSDREKWNPAAHGAFGTWIGDGQYAVERRVGPLKNERMRTAMFAQTVITPELLAGLDTAVLSDLFNAINPERSPQGFEALVHKVVRQAMDVAVDFEQKAQRAVFAPVKFDVPSAVHVALALEPQFVASAPQSSRRASGTCGRPGCAERTARPCQRPTRPRLRPTLARSFLSRCSMRWSAAKHRPLQRPRLNPIAKPRRKPPRRLIPHRRVPRPSIPRPPACPREARRPNPARRTTS